MSPRTPEQYEAIRARRRKTIVSAALRVFATRGVDTTSMEQIARRARISKGLIYNYFPSKKALLMAVAVKGMEELAGTFPSNVEELTPRQALETFINNTFDLIEQKREFFALYINLFTEPLVVPRYRSFFLQLIEPFRRFLASKLRQAGIPEAEKEAILLMSLLDGILLHVLIAREAYPLDAIRHLVLQKYVYPREDI
ncbi:MAG: TetR/AcrR family transcriptional regulator [Bacteroidota bacterium]